MKCFALYLVTIFLTGSTVATAENNGSSDRASSSGLLCKITEVERESSVAVYEPGDDIIWTVEVGSAGDDDGECQVNWRLVDWDGNIETGNEQVRWEDGKGKSVVTLTPERVGWYEVVFSVCGQEAAGGGRSFVVGEQSKSSGQFFRYGVSTHTGRDWVPEKEKEIELLDKLGVDIIRDEPMLWNHVEGVQGQWTFQRADAFVKKLTDVGIELQSILHGTARWATTGDPNASDWKKWAKVMPKMDPWLNHVRMLVGRYKDYVKYWEVWNEPDIPAWLGTTQEYIELFDATSHGVVETNPDAVVLNGGMAGIRRMPNPDFSVTFVREVDKADWGIWAYHDYHTLDQMLARNLEQKKLYDLAQVDIPVWINEGGFLDLLSGGERKQAVTLVKKIAAAPSLELPVTGYFWYDLVDYGTEPRALSHHFGLTRNNLDPKPSYAAYQALIRELGQAKFVRKATGEDSPAGTWALVYQLVGSDKWVVVLWRESSGLSIPVWLGGGAKSNLVAVRDMMGNTIIDHPDARGAVVPLSEEPIYAIYKGILPKVSLCPLLTGPNLVMVQKDSETDVPMTVTNPLDEVLAIKLLFESGSLVGVEWEPANLTLTLNPGEQRTVSSMVGLSGEEAVMPGHLVVRLKSDSPTIDVKASLPTDLALALPRVREGTPLDRHAALNLDLSGMSDIHNLYTAEPRPEMQWSGESDLSAVAHFSYTDKALLVEVTAQDNIHHQQSLGREMYNGDGLQLGIRLSPSDTGFVEIGLAMNDAGELGGWVSATTPRCDLALGRLDDPVHYNVKRVGEETIYQLSIPWEVLGVKGVPEGPFWMNFIVNDNDGLGRKQWVQLSPGIGDEKNANVFKVFFCE